MNRIFFLLTFLSLLLLFTDEVFTQDKEVNKEVIGKTPVENINSGSNGSGGSTIIPNQTNNNISIPTRTDLTEHSTISGTGSANVTGTNNSNSNGNNESNEIVLFDLRKFTDDNNDQVPDGWATNISNIQFAPEGEFCLKFNTENTSDNYFNYLFETLPNVNSYKISLEANIPLTSLNIKQYTSQNEILEEKNLIENSPSSQVTSIPFYITSNTNKILISVHLPQGKEFIIKDLILLGKDTLDEVQDEKN